MKPTLILTAGHNTSLLNRAASQLFAATDPARVVRATGMVTDYLKTINLSPASFAQMDDEQSADTMIGLFQYLMVQARARRTNAPSTARFVFMDKSPVDVIANLCASYPPMLFSRHLLKTELRGWLQRVRPIILYIATPNASATSESLQHDAEVFSLLRDCELDITGDVREADDLTRTVTSLLEKRARCNSCNNL